MNGTTSTFTALLNLTGPMITALCGANLETGALPFGTDGMVRTGLISRGLGEAHTRELSTWGVTIARAVQAKHGAVNAETGIRTLRHWN